VRYKQPEYTVFVVGLVFTDGPYWQEMRRFTLRNLRYFGFGKTSMEGQIIGGSWILGEGNEKQRHCSGNAIV